MQLFVDGDRVGRDQTYTNPKTYVGYWRIGSDQTTGFTNRPTDAGLSGTIDEVAMYAGSLTVSQIHDHYTASGRTGSWTAAAPADTYGAKVVQDDPDLFWRLNESSGTVADATSNGQPGTFGGTGNRGQVGAVAPGTAYQLTAGSVVANQSMLSPSVYSAEVWFKTTSTSGGRLIGFGSSTNTTLSSSYDRHVYMQNNGKLAFGSYNGVQNIVATSGAYNDGQWHHVVATQGADGMRLWVDTQLVGSNAVSTTTNYTGAWRLGGDRVWSGASSNFLNGSFDEFAVYSKTLSEASVRDHFTASGRNAVNRPPVAAFEVSRDKLKVSVDGAGSSDPDGPIASYAWDFGDGKTATGATAAHEYAAPGEFTVKLTVTDALGLTASKTATVVAVANQTPTAAFAANVQNMAVSLDADTSSDQDGTIASYAWDFGDGEHGTGKDAEHTYGTPGPYTVTLTVTDDNGATSTATEAVTAALPPNKLPQAQLTVNEAELKITVDAGDSSDDDGTIESYAWDFGDGATETGKTASHTYAGAGTYDVKVTVTDDRGGKDTATKSVTVAPHVAPEAAFSSSTNDLQVNLDATDSADTDGTVESYSWSFGDDTDDTGKTVSHTYALPGTYDVELTVTDDDGLTDTVTHQVTVTAPAVFAKDGFGRTATSGWGTADQGGTWSISAGASRYSVAEGVGKVQLNAGNGYTAYLNDVSSVDTEVKVAVTLDKVATGGGQYVSVIGRKHANADYRAKLRVGVNGVVTIWLVKTVNGTETIIATNTIAGLTYNPGDELNVRLQVTGSSPTQIRAKAWKGSDEPTAWAATGSDSTAGLQDAGAVGLYSYLSGSTTNGPVVVAYDKLWVGLPK